MITEKDILHKSYLDICENLTIKGLEEYNIKKLLFNETFYVQDLSWKSVIKNYIVTIMFDLNFRTQIDIEHKNDELVLLSSKWNRKDHDDYWDKICSCFSENTRISFADRRNSWRDVFKYFSFPNMFRNIKSARTIKRSLKDIKNKKHRNFLVNKLLQMEKLDRILKETKLKPKVAMCFFDSGFYENLAMQFFKNRGAITVTNQHGQPVFKSWDYDRMNQSQILNFKCDYFLAKGEFSRKQFVKAGFDENRVIVIGSFNNVKGYQRSYDIRNAFCTFLNCVALPNAKELNDKLLKITVELSERLNSKFYIKLHPSDSIENYQTFKHDNLLKIIERDMSIPEISEVIDFGLYNESAIFLDLLNNKTRAYRWDNGVFFPLVENNDDVFADSNDIEKKVNEWLEQPDSDKDDYFDRVSAYYNGNGNAPQNIKKFIDNLLKKN